MTFGEAKLGGEKRVQSRGEVMWGKNKTKRNKSDFCPLKSGGKRAGQEGRGSGHPQRSGGTPTVKNPPGGLSRLVSTGKGTWGRLDTILVTRGREWGGVGKSLSRVEASHYRKMEELLLRKKLEGE